MEFVKYIVDAALEIFQVVHNLSFHFNRFFPALLNNTKRKFHVSTGVI